MKCMKGTGNWNSWLCWYFQDNLDNDKLKYLNIWILKAIRDVTSVSDMSSKLILHYFIVMNREIEDIRSGIIIKLTDW